MPARGHGGPSAASHRSGCPRRPRPFRRPGAPPATHKISSGIASHALSSHLRSVTTANNYPLRPAHSSAEAVTDARRPVSLSRCWPTSWANALLDRGDRHRDDSPLAPDTQMILHCAVHTPRGIPGPATLQTSDLLQITKYRFSTQAAAHRFPQVSELSEAKPAPRLPLRSGPFTGSLFELCG
jgi:hypothetical protein